MVRANAVDQPLAPAACATPVHHFFFFHEENTLEKLDGALSSRNKTALSRVRKIEGKAEAKRDIVTRTEDKTVEYGT